MNIPYDPAECSRVEFLSYHPFSRCAPNASRASSRPIDATHNTRDAAASMLCCVWWHKHRHARTTIFESRAARTHAVNIFNISSINACIVVVGGIVPDQRSDHAMCLLAVPFVLKTYMYTTHSRVRPTFLVSVLCTVYSYIYVYRWMSVYTIFKPAQWACIMDPESRGAYNRFIPKPENTRTQTPQR